VKFAFEHKAEVVPIDLVPGGPGKSYRATLGEKVIDVEILQANDGKLDLLIDGKRLTAYVSTDHAKRWVTVNGLTLVLTRSSSGRKGAGGYHYKAGELTAPMPGQVRAVNVGEGDMVTKGQTLLVLEAMKMEIRVQASHEGVVRKLFVSQGQTVEREQMLVEIEEN
jgi:biotin carboxyl carrier protein